MKMNKWWLHQYCNNNGSVKLRLNQCKPNKENYCARLHAGGSPVAGAAPQQLGALQRAGGQGLAG